MSIWRIQCTTCRAVFTVLPHFVLRYRAMHPEVARDALLAAHGGLSLERCAVICHLFPMALYHLVCAFGHQSLVMVLTRCGLPLPSYVLADEKHSRCLTDKVYLPTVVSGRVLWHLGYTEEASAAALTQSYGEFQHAALQQEPAYRVLGILTDGFDSTTKSMRTLFPGARLGNCLRHALTKLPGKLVAIASPVPQALRSQFHTLWYRARQRQGLRVFALGQRWRRFADYVALIAGVANGKRVQQWFLDKKAEILPDQLTMVKSCMTCSLPDNAGCDDRLSAHFCPFATGGPVERLQEEREPGSNPPRHTYLNPRRHTAESRFTLFWSLARPKASPHSDSGKDTTDSGAPAFMAEGRVKASSLSSSSWCGLQNYSTPFYTRIIAKKASAQPVNYGLRARQGIG